jgi:2-polyprenyl-3-methyl-5-hydroxy-6-metoxy-1,4-benzoquinol methylase
VVNEPPNLQPFDEEVDYRTRLYGAYVSTGQATVDASRAGATLAQQIVKRLPPDPEARVLDIGCGNGALLLQISQAGYRNVTGVDVSEEQVALARQRGLSDVIQADLLGWLEATTEQFDVVVAVDLVEHFDPPNVLGVLDRIWRVLTPGGSVIIRTPNAEGPFGARYRYSDLTHGLAFTARSMRQALAASGFVGIEVHEAAPVAHGLKSFARSALWKAIDRLLRLYLAIELGTAREAVLTQNLIAVGRHPIVSYDEEVRKSE